MPVKILADSENIRPIFGKEKPRTMARSKKIMIITFIHHSSFLVETDSLYLLFDYFRGTLPELDPAKPLYVLTSHSHSDHYSRKIFSLTDRRMAKGTEGDAALVTFLLGHDIDPRDIPTANCKQTHILQPHETYQDSLLKVETLHSTDEGIAFWCTAADGAVRQQIYHAGDHSNWIWEGTAHNIGFVHMYHEELARIAGRTADVAMLSMDPRLDKEFAADWYYKEFPLHRRADGWMQPRPEKARGWALTIQEYMQYADARVIFPMHQWGQFDLTDRFCALKENAAYADRVVHIKRDGESWEI